MADPYWPVKVQLGKEDKIRKCISCLTGCWQESLMSMHEISCAVNPMCGDLDYYRMDKGKAERSFKIGIVGGGPGGWRQQDGLL